MEVNSGVHNWSVGQRMWMARRLRQLPRSIGSRSASMACQCCVDDGCFALGTLEVLVKKGLERAIQQQGWAVRSCSRRVLCSCSISRVLRLFFEGGVRAHRRLCWCVKLGPSPSHRQGFLQGPAARGSASLNLHDSSLLQLHAVQLENVRVMQQSHCT